MIVSELAKRYGRALFELAQELNQIDTYGSELNGAAKAFSANTETKRFAESPLIRGAEKEKALNQVFSKLKISDSVSSFLFILARKGRLAIIDQIAAAYGMEQDASKGITRGTVTSSRKLSDTDKIEIRKILSQATGKQVEAEFDIDDTLVAGIRAQVGSLSIDDSLVGHLNRMQEELNRSVH